MNKLSLRNIVIVALIAIAASIYGALTLTKAFAGTATYNPTITAGTFENYTFFSATTTSATSTTDGSTGLNISGAKKVTFYFSREYGGGNSGSSRFSIQVSPDGTNWYDYDSLIQNTATSSAPGYSVSSITISAATSTTMAYMDLFYGAFKDVRCVVVETTDGSHTCKASAEF